MDIHDKQLLICMTVACITSLVVFMFSPLRIESKIGFAIFALFIEYFEWYYHQERDIKREQRARVE